MFYVKKIAFSLIAMLMYVPLNASQAGDQELELTHSSRLSVADAIAAAVTIQSNNQDDRYEFFDTCSELPASCQRSCVSCWNSCQTSTSDGYSVLQEVEFSSACKKSAGCLLVSCIITGIVVGCVLGIDTHSYQIYNRESKTIDIHYQPGCGSNKDCVKTVRPNKYAKIHAVGDLTKLCAVYSYGWSSFGKRECVTQDGLKDRNWYVHDHLTFTRGKDEYSGVNATAQSFRLYKHESLGTDAPYYNLRDLVPVEKK